MRRSQTWRDGDIHPFAITLDPPNAGLYLRQAMTSIINTPGLDKNKLAIALSAIFPRLYESERGIFLAEQLQLFNEAQAMSGVTIEEINEVSTNLGKAVSADASGITWPNRAEFVITSLNNDRAFTRFFDDRTVEGQGEGALTYKIRRPSKEFTAFLACSLFDEDAIRRSNRWTFVRHRARALSTERYRGLYERFSDASLLDLVGEILGILTIHIEAPSPRGDFEKLANSFLFHVAYNMDIAARLGNAVDTFLRSSRIQRVRRVDPDVFDAPRRTYNTDLIHHYLVGVAAEIPLLEYLSYYHIAEHYFEKVFNDDLVEQVQKGITDPSFSVRRTKDVQGVIKIINKAQRQVREEGGVNEQRALQLVIEKFVDISRLADDLDAYDGTLVDYYKRYGVAFADAEKVDLRHTDLINVKTALAKRIYKVRNSLVHAKEGGLPRYAPFAHDAELAKEIPLIRFTAEQIIISHGQIM